MTTRGDRRTKMERRWLVRMRGVMSDGIVHHMNATSNCNVRFPLFALDPTRGCQGHVPSLRQSPPTLRGSCLPELLAYLRGEVSTAPVATAAEGDARLAVGSRQNLPCVPQYLLGTLDAFRECRRHIARQQPATRLGEA